VRGERVDDVVKEDVALMKMDVEGFEAHVLEVQTFSETKLDKSLSQGGHGAHEDRCGGL